MKRWHIMALMLVAMQSIGDRVHPQGRFITLREMATFEPKGGFIKVGEVATDAFNNVYVADDYAYSVKKFSASGIVRKEFGQRGKAEGDFKSFLFRMVCRNDTLAISELGNSRVLLFNTGGEFIRQFPVGGTIIDVAFDSRMRSYVSMIPFSGKKEEYLMLYDVQGRLIANVSPRHLVNDPSLDMIQLAVDARDNLIVAYHFFNCVEVFDSHLKPKADFFLDELPRQSPTVASRYKEVGLLPRGEVIKDITVDPDGNLFILSGDYSSSPNQDVYVMSNDGHRLAKLKLPSKTGFIYIDNGGFLYTRERKRTSVKKYRMIYHGFTSAKK